MILPDDIINYIIEINASTKIQKEYRRHMLRHVNNVEWIHILKRLVELECDINLLCSSYWIRREWCLEPESWIYMLTHSPADVKKITLDLIPKSDL
tara:strand:- start:1305 stop:1592 length:288 start_codon:yes stop_codon:yes gene_type:complete